MKKTVVFIICLGHSGSTLIGNILDSHSKGIHIGEIPSPLGKGYPVICRNCLDKNCPVWGRSVDEKTVKKIYNNYKNRYVKSLGLKKIIGLLYNHSGLLYKKIFDNFPHKEFIIDSSKNLNWYKYNYNHQLFNYKYIFINRDIHAIYASYKRNGKMTKTIDSFIKNQKVKVNQLNDFYSNIPKNDKYTIKYEEFCENPESYTRDICSFLDIDYELSMLNFQKYEHHLIGGNTKLLFYKHHNLSKLKDLLNIDPKDTAYYRKMEGINLDNRWKDELSELEIKKIDDSGINQSFMF